MTSHEIFSHDLHLSVLQKYGRKDTLTDLYMGCHTYRIGEKKLISPNKLYHLEATVWPATEIEINSILQQTATTNVHMRLAQMGS